MSDDESLALRTTIIADIRNRADSESPTEVWAIGGMKQYRPAIEALIGPIDVGAQHVLVRRPARDQL